MLGEIHAMCDQPYDYWRARACGLLCALDVASAEELAETVGMPVEVILEHAEPFISEKTFEEFAAENSQGASSTANWFVSLPVLCYTGGGLPL